MNRRPIFALALALLLAPFIGPVTVSAQSDAVETMGLLAAVRYCVDEDCTELEGSVDAVSVAFASDNGAVQYGTCQTVADAAPDGCSVQVPIGVPVAVSIDESTIPEGWTPVESTIVTTITDTPEFFAVTFGLRADDEEPAATPEDDPPSQDPATVTGELTGLGLSFEEFQAIYGEGEPIDEVNTLFEFANPDFDGYTLLASFPDGLTGHIEFGYEEAEAGGLPRGEVAPQVEGALPTDASLAESYVVSAPNAGDPTLHVERYESALLGAVADGRTGILLAYQEVLTDGGSVVVRATVTMPTLNAGSPVATGDPGGIGLTQDAWEAVYGPGRVSQGGVVYENVPFGAPGSVVTVRFTGPDATIGGVVFAYGDGSQLGGASREEVFTQHLASIPADAVYQGSYYLPSTPDGPIALVVDRWESAELAEITGGDGSILAVTQQREAQQNPGSPPELVVPQMDIVIAS
jgi:hypothetical protein